MRVLHEEPGRLDDTGLQSLIRALRHMEQDFRSRAAGQVSASGQLEGMHGPNPVHKALLFMHRKVGKQLQRAEEELSTRASASPRDHFVHGERQAQQEASA